MVYWLMNQKKSYIENFGGCDFGTSSEGQDKCMNKQVGGPGLKNTDYSCMVNAKPDGKCSTICPSPKDCKLNKECRLDTNGNCVAARAPQKEKCPKPENCSKNRNCFLTVTGNCIILPKKGYRKNLINKK